MPDELVAARRVRAAVQLVNGRTAEIGATRALKAVSLEIVGTVLVMNGRNRQRFAADGQLLELD